MPYKFRRISQTKVNKILKCFASDISAAQTAKIVGVNRNTANDWFNCFRKEILKFQEKENGSFQGEVELDESYFGGKKKKKHPEDKRKRGRGAENKVPVFGIKTALKTFGVLPKDDWLNSTEFPEKLSCFT